MVDHNPQRTVADDRETLLELLQFHRASLLRKLDGLDEERARRSPVPSGTSLLWLVKHATRAEHTWVHHRFTGDHAGIPQDRLLTGDTIASVTAAYRAMWAHTDTVVAAASLDDICADQLEGDQVNLRWILAHLLGEIGRHAGHADILRELLDGSTGR